MSGSSAPICTRCRWCHQIKGTHWCHRPRPKVFDPVRGWIEAHQWCCETERERRDPISALFGFEPPRCGPRARFFQAKREP